MTAMASPIIRLGCTVLDPRATRAHRTWGCITGIQDTCAGSMEFNCPACWADTCDPDPYADPIDPATSEACWVLPSRLESLRFWGPMITMISGLDDPVVSRNVITTIGGGAVVGPEVIGARGFRMEGILLAADCEAMEYGKAWFTRLVSEACRWQPFASLDANTGGCGTGQVTVRTQCPPTTSDPDSGLFTLHGVAATGGVLYEKVVNGPCCCNIVKFAVDFVAGRPEMWTVTSALIMAFDPSTVTADDTVSTVTCVAAEASCITDPTCTTATVSAPTFAVAASIDAYGRPSCGPGSASYDSAKEAIWTDTLGRPSCDAGSGHYLDPVPVGPSFDYWGAPSCGPESNLYGAMPAVSAAKETLYVNTTVTPSWTTRTATTRLLPAQLNSMELSVIPAGGARIRRISRTLTWVNPNATPSTQKHSTVNMYTGETDFIVHGYAGNGVAVPIGWVVDVLLTWDELIPSGSVSATCSTGNHAATVSPNGGQFPTFDAANRPSCGPGSANYLDEIASVDALGRPSCGTGSANYNNEEAVFDDSGRPSCGPGSGLYRSYPAVTGGSGISPTFFSGQYGPNSASFLGLNSCSLGSFVGKLKTNTAEVITNLTAHYDYTSTTGVKTSGTTVIATGPIQLATVAIGATVTEYQFILPGLPTDAKDRGNTNVFLEWTTAQLGSGIAVGSNSFVEATWNGCAATSGPNGGLERQCTPGPNAGTDRACTEGPNATDINCGGTNVTCSPCVLGPNNGEDRACADCVTTVSVGLTGVQTGWSSIADPLRVPKATAYPASNACFLPLADIAEGAALPGLIVPSGSAPFLLNLDDTAFNMCTGSVVLSGRLRVKMTTPTSSDTAWRGWYIGAYYNNAEFIGGMTARSTTALATDSAGYINWPLTFTAPAKVDKCAIYCDIATMSGGTQGSIDHVIFEYQYKGGPLCQDCGPNNGVDVDCIAKEIAVSCYKTPTHPATKCGTYVPDCTGTTSPMIEIVTGDTAARNIRVRMWPNTSLVDAMDVDPDQWACNEPCADGRISYVPPNSTLTIDPRGRHITALCRNLPAEAASLVTGWRWPSIDSAASVCVTIDRDHPPESVNVTAWESRL